MASESSQEQQSRTLFLGDLEQWMDEAYLTALIDSLNYSKEVGGIKMIKDKSTGQLARYCFVQFVTRDSAINFYTNFSNQMIPNTNKLFTLKWASRAAQGKLKAKTGPQVYVSGLDPSTTEDSLLQLFQMRCPSALAASIKRDQQTKAPKYAFITFQREEEAAAAINEMNGAKYMGRLLKVSPARTTSKESVTEEGQTQASQRIKLYKHFYSLLNDPTFKNQYQQQMQTNAALAQPNKPTLKQTLDSVQTYTYAQTVKSLDLLAFLPKIRSARAKAEIEQRIFS